MSHYAENSVEVPFIDEDNSNERCSWLVDNSNGSFFLYDSYINDDGKLYLLYLFEIKEDAFKFKMRWG